MAKLIFFIAIFGWSAAEAKSLQLELYAQTVLEKNISVDGSKVGGLSGMFWNGSKLVAVSDDRGKFGSPRFFELELKLSDAVSVKATEKSSQLKLKGTVELKPTKAVKVSVPDKAWVLDLEALVDLGNGEYLLSTEGDTNKKPRAMPHLFVVNSEGKYKSDLTLPEKFLPEPLGEQKRGVENNRAFEGVSLTPDQKHLFAMNEGPLVTDSTPADCTKSWLRLIDFAKNDQGEFKPGSEFAYPVEKIQQEGKGPEVFRGVSEILALDAHNIIILERGVRLTSKGVSYTGGIYAYDFSALKDISKVSPLCMPTQAAGKKELLVDLSTALKAEGVENFEAMAWGPLLADGQRTLLVMSDNNFSSSERTQLLVFAVKEVP